MKKLLYFIIRFLLGLIVIAFALSVMVLVFLISLPLVGFGKLKKLFERFTDNFKRLFNYKISGN